MSGTRIRVCDRVSVSDAKAIQYNYARDEDHYAPGVPRAEVRHRIKNVRDGAVRAMMCAVPAFAETDIQRAWGHHMAVVAGRHRFDDANHRTGHDTFDSAISREWGVTCSLSAQDAERMVKESKRTRRPDFTRMGRVYLLDELADPQHRYRQVFAAYENKLRCRKVA